MIPAVGIIAILTSELLRAGTSVVLQWTSEHFGVLIGSLLLSITGLRYLARPEEMLRQTFRDRPEVPERESAVLIARLIGIGLIAMGFILLRGL